MIAKIFFDTVIDRNSKRNIQNRPPDIKGIDTKKYSGFGGNEEVKQWYKENRKDVYCTSFDNLKLHGYYIDHQSDTTVIICHGFSTSAMSMSNYTKHFYDLGYNTLTLDARSHGQSEGRYVSMGWLERYDLIEWMKQYNHQFILFGVSMGGSTVLNTSALKDVKAVISDCGYSSVYDEFKHQFKISKLPVFPFLKLASKRNKRFNGFYFEEANTKEIIKQSHSPTLLIHGDEDQFVPYTMMDEIYDSLTCVKEKYLMKGAGHALCSSYDETAYWDKIKQFLDKI